MTNSPGRTRSPGIRSYRQGRSRAPKAFEMEVVVANRSPVATSPLVDRSFLLDDLAAFWGAADFIVVSVPLTAETDGIVGSDAFAAMRPTAVVLNVGRGRTVNERCTRLCGASASLAPSLTRGIAVQIRPDRCSAVSAALSRIAERSHDAAHVRLDVGHDTSEAEDDRRQHHAPRPW